MEDRSHQFIVDWAVALQDPRLRRIFAYWNEKRGARAMPTREDIDPMELRDVLPHLFLMDALAEDRDFRYRLIGTGIVQVFGADATGKRVSEIFPPDFLIYGLPAHLEVVERRVPVRLHGQLWLRKRDHLNWEAVVMPLSAGGAAGTVGMLFGAMVFHPA